MTGGNHPPATAADDLRERYIGMQFHSIEERLAEAERRMSDVEKQLAAMREELRDNSEITQDIREILIAARVGLRVLGGLGQVVKWIGIVAGGLAAIYGAWQAITKGLQLPTKG
jgi:chromosome segregation ATPase